MEFTGERLVPTVGGLDDLFLEHMTRYLFASSLIEGKRVLDAGCGCGYGSYHLARGGAESVLGIDISEEAVAYCREHYRSERLSYEQRDVLNTGLDEASFDAIVCFEVFEHVPEPEVLLDEMRRLLRPDGVLVLSTPNANTYAAGGKDGDNPFHYREYTPDEFEGLLKNRFPQVFSYAQNRAGGLSILPVHSRQTGTTLLTCAHLVRPPSESTWGEPAPTTVAMDLCRYLIAVCYREERDLASLPGARWYSMGDSLGLQEVDSDLDSRTQWIESLQQELELRDQTIERLQVEFEDRTRWALELDEQVRQRDRLIANLQSPLSGRGSRRG
ncbi:MAG: class I SAM-dependent methyltransferase [Candidatus Eisenbacteria sp.]|nr:class I SAM-dependent methyltransferase [Candidatus Eisenbacteria bacterium]